MDPPDPPGDDRLAEALAAYDQALAAGGPCPSNETVPFELTAEEDVRLREDQRCLELLEHLWPRRRTAGDAAEGPSPVLQQLGRFRLRHELGRGGFGIVYLADDGRLGRPVAVKVPRPDVLLTPSLRRRFLREVRAAARLNHPHILPVFESTEDGPLCYMVMPCCAGGNLAHWLADRPPLSPDAAAALTAVLAGAVQHAHERGVLHRDLKPANVLLEPAGQDGGRDAGPCAAFGFVPRIADFGLAKILEGPDEPGPDGPSVPPTQGHAAMGTPAYMAPEQAEGRWEDVGPATDVHALGVLLYELITGQPPYRGRSAAETLRLVALAEPVPPSRLRPDLPRALEAICLKCLERCPAARYASAAALAEDLRRFCAGQATRVRPHGPWARLRRWCGRRPAVAALVAIAALGLASAGGLLAWHCWTLDAHDAALAAAALRAQQQATAAELQAARIRAHEARARREAYARQIITIGNHWHDGHHGQMRALLAELRPAAGQEDLRGFEWGYLWDQGHRLRRLVGHADPPTAIHVSRDGRRCVSIEEGKTLFDWRADADRLQGRRTLHAHAWSTTIGFTRDGTRVAVVAAATPDGPHELLVYDVATGRRLARRPTLLNGLACALSPDGRLLAYNRPAAGGGGELHLWDTLTDEDGLLWAYAGREVTALCFLPDGRALAIAQGPLGPPAAPPDYRVTLWDLNGKRRWTSGGTHLYRATALAVSPDGRTLASGAWDATVRLWDVATGQERYVFQPGAFPTVLVFSPDSKTLAIGAQPHLPQSTGKGDISLWDIAAHRRLPSAPPSGVVATTLAFDPEGKALAIGDVNGLVRLWQIEPTSPCVVLPAPNRSEAWGVAFSPDGATLAVGYDDQIGVGWGHVRLWDVAQSRVRATLKGHTAMVFTVAFAPDGKALASSSWDGTVRIWDPGSGDLRRELFGHEGPVRTLAYAQDGRILLTAGNDGVPRSWDAATGELRMTWQDHGTMIARVAFDRDGRRFATVAGKSTRIWARPAHDPPHLCEDTCDVSSLAFSPDGTTLVTGNQQGMIRVWDTATGQLRDTLKGHPPGVRGGVLSLVYAPDGKTLASGGEDGTVRLWQAATGTQLLCLKGQPAAVNTVAFSRDGRRLAAALHDGTVRIWDSSMPAD